MVNSCIIVLGKTLCNDGSLPHECKARIDHAMSIAENNTIIFSSFHPGNEIRAMKLSIAEAMKEYALRTHALSQTLILEDVSKDTLGNALYCKKMITSWVESPPCVTVVTDQSHMTRTRWIFKRVFGESIKFSTVQYDFPWKKRVYEWFYELKSWPFAVLFTWNLNNNETVLATRLEKFHPFYRR